MNVIEGPYKIHNGSMRNRKGLWRTGVSKMVSEGTRGSGRVHDGLGWSRKVQEGP